MSRLIARRVRSRDQETESTNARIMRRGSVTRWKIPDRTVTEAKQWPGGPRVRPGDLTPETVAELDGRFEVGETICMIATAHAAAGEVTFDADPAWRTGFSTFDTGGATTTRRGYYAASVSLVADGLIDTGSVAVYVDGVESVGPTLDAGLTLDGCDEFRDTIHLPETLPGQELSLYVDPGGTSIDVVVTFLLVETTPALAQPDPILAPEEVLTRNGDDTGAGTATVELAPPEGTQVGDVVVAISIGASTSGDIGTTAVPAEFEELITFPYLPGIGGGGDGSRTRITWKRMESAGDVSATYTWSQGSTGVAWQLVHMLTIPAASVRASGVPFGAIEQDSGFASGSVPTLTATTTDGWVLCCISGINNQTTPGSSPDMELEWVAPVTNMSAYLGAGSRNGRTRTGLCDPGDSVTATFGSQCFQRTISAIEVLGAA